MAALLGLSISGYGYMRQGFFPDMVYDQLYMEYKLPEGNNSTRVARDLREIEAYLKTRKEITHVTASIVGTLVLRRADYRLHLTGRPGKQYG